MRIYNIGKVMDKQTFIEVLRHYAQSKPELMAYRFLRNGEEESESRSFAELDEEVRALAVSLQEQGLQGERILLLYHSGMEYLISLLACFYAGAIAIPAYPPRNTRNMPRIRMILADAGAKAILTTSIIGLKTLDYADESEALDGINWLFTDTDISGDANNWVNPELGADDLAYLQYTSGSTGEPKGVMISHGNLIHNVCSVHKLFAHDENSVMVSWLPIFHDLGLIFGLLQSLYGGFTCVFMSPAAFLQRPYRWLKAISDYRATTSGAPNFAFELCLKKITEQQKQTLDLSSWRNALNGAEPVRSSTIEKFNDYFASCGFKDSTLSPCYGLAEATLVVSGTTNGHSTTTLNVDAAQLELNKVQVDNGQPFIDSKKQVLASSGAPFVDQELVIVDLNDFSPMSDGLVGEIWVSGPSIAKGYWQREADTEEVFLATIRGKQDKKYMRTGDLGFLQDGMLYVTGRLKDVIIIRGRNLYPQDIELVSERSHPALRPSGAGAFSIDVNGSERLVVIQELEFKQKVKYDLVIDAIRQMIVENFEIQPYAIQLIKPGSIFKTSSGKIQRKLTRQHYLENKLQSLFGWQEEVNVEEYSENISSLAIGQQVVMMEKAGHAGKIKLFLRTILSDILNLEESRIDNAKSLIMLGLDSIGAATLAESINSNLEINIPIVQLFDNANVENLTENIVSQLSVMSS